MSGELFLTSAVSILIPLRLIIWLLSSIMS